jgi:uncharacterized membrane protein
MTKREFLVHMKRSLSHLPRKERKERLAFYGEMIDDRMEEGLTEEEAVAAVGSPEQILHQIAPPAPSDTVQRRRLTVGIILLLILGSPLWLSLLIGALSAILSVYVSLWSVIISLWAVFVSLVACAVGLTVAGIISLCTNNMSYGFVLVGTALISAGLAIFLFFGCKALTNGTAAVTKKIFLAIKNRIAGKEKAL